MGRLEAIRIFTRVAETRNFSKTAEVMDMPRGTVSRIIQTLEGQVGVRLLTRSTRQVNLTDAGKMYYERCKKILEELSMVESELSNIKSVPSGTIRVGTTGTIAEALVMPNLDEFLREFPDIDVRVGIADRNICLVQEGLDCVIRAGALEESSLVARRVGNARLVTCASPTYLEKYGVPESIEDLESHVAVNYISAKSGKLFPFEFERDGEIAKVELRGRVAVDEGIAYVNAAVRGLGIIQPSRYIVADLLQSGQLREIFPTFRIPTIPISIVYPHRSHISSATRAFTNWITGICVRNDDLSAQPTQQTRSTSRGGALVAVGDFAHSEQHSKID
ncbi:LysR family transcriptional regulator [Paraburkholderia flagellata]|uniref:LysR family transcriptional regulator n=1 Tax=Paraburkholderia flagellata TaxID=2883241 RepID=UPI001F38AF04|nr:LysR family transcriptional regulator [Paraburkholderia flagellata]